MNADQKSLRKRRLSRRRRISFCSSPGSMLVFVTAVLFGATLLAFFVVSWRRDGVRGFQRSSSSSKHEKQEDEKSTIWRSSGEVYEDALAESLAEFKIRKATRVQKRQQHIKSFANTDQIEKKPKGSVSERKGRVRGVTKGETKTVAKSMNFKQQMVSNGHIKKMNNAQMKEETKTRATLKHRWPIPSVKTEPNSDAIHHPLYRETIMDVPAFFSPPIHNMELMTREKAMTIGSCIEPDPKSGSFARGEECPVDKRTIHVAIASYRDFQCRQTVHSIFSRAKHPERIRVGVVDQIFPDKDVACNEPFVPCEKDPSQALCVYSEQVDIYTMDPKLAVGPVFARHIGMRLYRGEYFYSQNDAHVEYALDWDVSIISQFYSSKNEMAVLSTYLTDISGNLDKAGHSLITSRPIMCNTRFGASRHLIHDAQPETDPEVHGQPQLHPFWAAGYSFSRGHFAVNVPYDPWQSGIFQGEEVSIVVRAWTVGYDVYAPEVSVCFHQYEGDDTVEARARANVTHYWDNETPETDAAEAKAMDRLIGIIHMHPQMSAETWDHTDEEIYGLGGVRTPEKFYEVLGIDVVNKTVPKRLCRFVDKEAKMHELFTPHMRSDGMGIDYSKIDYRFVDPIEEKKEDE